MDPYLEESDLWGDCHVTMIVAMRAELNARLPVAYMARADRYVWLHEPDAQTRTRLGKPDVFITDRRASSGTRRKTATLTAPAATVLPAVRREGNAYLRVLDRRGRRVVTVIELLSP